MKNIFIILNFCLLCVVQCYAQENSLATNVYSKTMHVYSDYVFLGRLRSQEYFFSGVRGGGVEFEMDGIHLERFMDLVSVVSNNCEAIASDWHTYETNEMVRFTTLSAVGFSGYNNYTNFVDGFLTFCETDSRTNYWNSIKFIFDPYGTKVENQLALNYENVTISNIIQRFRQQATIYCNTNYIELCDEILSGEWKQEHLKMEAAGAL